jgi:putative SOS response-associated peptidase YedK
MCGRFVQSFAKEDIQQQFPKLLIDVNWLEKDGSRSFNVAPGHLVWVLDNADSGNKVILNRLQWGFNINTAVKTRKMIINIRLDRLLNSVNWAKAITENRRVLIPANGWYEWKREQGKNQNSLPHYFEKVATSNSTDLGSKLMYFAGLIDTHGNFGIVTQAASEDITHIHDRMPLVLDSENERAIWLQKSSAAAVSLTQKKQQNSAVEHTYNSTLVSTKVNKVANNEASLLHESTPPPTQGSLF